MAGTDATDLYGLAEEFLFACEDALNTVPTFDGALEGSPVRSFVAPGQPAATCCPQLTVHVVAITEDQLGAPVPGRSAMTTRLNQVTLAMTLFRCAPTAQIPEVSELVAVAQQVDADGWALWNHLFGMVRAGTLFSTCGEAKWGQLRSLPEEGGCVGWFWPVDVALDGYEETLTS